MPWLALSLVSFDLRCIEIPVVLLIAYPLLVTSSLQSPLAKQLTCRERTTHPEPHRPLSACFFLVSLRSSSTSDLPIDGK